MTSEDLDKTIRSYFKDIPGVAAVFLFGSFASGRERTGSDVDIAVLIAGDDPVLAEKMQAQAYLRLSRILKMDVHLVTLNSVSAELNRQVLAKGRCVVNALPGTLLDFKTRMISAIADYGYYRDIFQRAVVERVMQYGTPAEALSHQKTANGISA